MPKYMCTCQELFTHWTTFERMPNNYANHNSDCTAFNESMKLVKDIFGYDIGSIIVSYVI